MKVTQPSNIPFSQFDMTLWGRALTLEPTFVPPPEAAIKVVLDPAFTANEQSDESALVAGFVDRNDSQAEEWPLILLDAQAGRFKGMKLVEVTLDFIAKWKPQYFSEEAAAGRHSDLFDDALREKAQDRGIRLPPINRNIPLSKLWSKAKRVAKIQTELLTPEPPLLKIRQGGFVEALFHQARRFDFTRADNQCREDGMVDALSRLAGFN